MRWTGVSRAAAVRPLSFFGIRLLFCILLLASAGCGISHIRALREAQATFSRAAEIDNSERLNDLRSLGELSEATSGYRITARLSETLLAKKEKELRQDNLLCTAYLLRATSLWRLGQHDAAVETASRGDSCEGEPSTSPREKAILRAIPGLVRIDEANARNGNQIASKDEYDATKREITEALGILEGAGHVAPAGNPVQAYLLVSRLAAIRVWQVAVDRENLSGEFRQMERKAGLDKAQETLTQYRRFLECQGFRNRDDPTVSKWRQLLGLPASDERVDCRTP